MSETAATTPPLRTVEEFLDWVETREERWEFAAGRLVMMAGGSTPHNDIQMNLHDALRRRLRGGPCRVNGPDLLLRVDDRTGRFPDATVTCTPRGRNFTADPVAVFEILSPSSEGTDRGQKRREYQHLPSVRHYVLIAQDALRVEVYTRAADGWLFREIEGREADVALDAIGVTLPLAELYDDVDLGAA